MKILIKPHLLRIEDIVAVKLILIIIIIAMKLILILLFMSKFCVGIVNLKNAKHLKKMNEELMPAEWYPKK